MDRELLRKVQLTQLDIAKEIKRVCEENGIKYFLCCGTLLGAVRHGGFIPWDDDLDIGMLRADYETFCKVAPKALKPEYFLQNWHTEPAYALPFGKVMRRNTVYLEKKKTTKLQGNGIYVDIFPFDYVPVNMCQRMKLTRKLMHLFRTKLMKSNYQPWMNEDRIVWKKRLGYLYYQAKALFASNAELIEKFDALVKSAPESGVLIRQDGIANQEFYESRWFEVLQMRKFEDEEFPVPEEYDAILTAQYGDYMQLPPENERENRHQIYQVSFGEET